MRGGLAVGLVLAAVAAAAMLHRACGRRTPGTGDTALSSDQDGARPVPDTERDRAARAGMVETQIEARGVMAPAVLVAMRDEPRHAYVPAAQRPEAYSDRPLPIGHGQTISQPYIVALMTAALDIRPGAKVLEVGTGSGYQAAILDRMGAEVYSIEIVQPLCERAARDLARQGHGKVRVRCGDGYGGWPEAAPFDAIIVTAAPDHVPEALTEQLARGGRLVLPVGPAGSQWLVRIVKDEDGGLTAERLERVLFVPMTGAARPGLRLSAPDVTEARRVP